MGLTGLDDCRGRESQLPISPEEQAALRERIEAGPTDEDQVCSLRGKDFQRVLAQEFGVMRSLPAVYRLLHRLGYSYLRPRPRHRKADSQVIEAFKLSWPEQIKAIAKEHPGKRLRVYLSGRFTVWPTRDNHQCLGRAGLSSHGGSPDGVSVPVGTPSGLPREGATPRGCSARS